MSLENLWIDSAKWAATWLPFVRGTFVHESGRCSQLEITAGRKYNNVLLALSVESDITLYTYIGIGIDLKILYIDFY